MYSLTASGMAHSGRKRNHLHPSGRDRQIPGLFLVTVIQAIILLILLLISVTALSQSRGMKWAATGHAYYRIENNEIVKYTLPENKPEVIVTKSHMTLPGTEKPLRISYYAFSEDQKKMLIFTNTKRVWRLNSKGDYYVLDLSAGTLVKLGKTLPESSLMFAKFSPDSKSVAYVSGNNIYTENLADGKIIPLTSNGTVTLINGTFDWVYEEEFSCRDGFRWSPDSKSIAYWQLDAGSIRKFYMINNTDSIYSQLIPIEYPKVGEPPSSCRVGVVSAGGGATTWMELPGDPVQHYIVRMEFIPGTNELLIQQLNRKQNESRLFVADASRGTARLIQEETDPAWVDLYQPGNTYTIDYTNNFIWTEGAPSILWVSEKDGWRHLYQVFYDGRPEKLLTPGEYDMIELKHADFSGGMIWFTASPENATQKYLYSLSLKDKKARPELQSPAVLKGTHEYSFSSDGKYATHNFSNHFTKPSSEFIETTGHKPLDEKKSILVRVDSLKENPTTEFFRIKTADGIEVDGWMAKPRDFDPSKKYPVLFYVYTEPASGTVFDLYGISQGSLYDGDLAADGYLYVSLDNRGTPVPRGREWRKSIYRKIGQVNIRDQAMAAAEVLKWPYVDTSRVAVWGWSGGGSATLNLMFQYPQIYKTGISIAPVSNLLTYDNIYQERYMGLPQENLQDFIAGSPVTYAKNLTGHLLLIHGTGDDNVHYQNAEMVINELVKYNKQFDFMAYPNRSHSIREGEGTSAHLSTLFTRYLRQYCPPGAR